MSRWRATYRWKALDEGYNFALNFISIRGLHAKLWTPKVVGILVVGISGQNAIWVLVLWPSTKYIQVYYKGEGGGFPQVRAVVNLVSPSLLMARLNTKSVLTMH
jgi:hypothetical protein